MGGQTYCTSQEENKEGGLEFGLFLDQALIYLGI